MGKLLKALVSWPVLAIQGLALAAVCWGWSGGWVTWFWLAVFAVVLIMELLNKLFSPKKQTVSNNIRDEAINSPIRFWVMIAIWIMFAFTLAGHFMVRLF